jgi:hypothetical protein
VKKSSVQVNDNSKRRNVKGHSPAKRTPKKRKIGRPKYVVNKTAKKVAYELAKKGCNEKEIAKALRISQKTFQRNKAHFLPLIKKGRSEGEPKNIRDVENALLKRAKGFEYTEKHTIEQVTKDGDIVILHRTITKMIPPDTAAAIFYLCNRAKGRWQNVQHIEGGDIDKPIQIVVKGMDLSKYPEAKEEATAPQ